MAVDERGPWGEFILFRDSDDPPFDADDAKLMRDLSAVLARGLRRQAVTPSDGADSSPAEMGVLLLGDDLVPRGSTAAARAWFTALNPAQSAFPDGIPGVVWNVVGRLLAIERGEDLGQPPVFGCAAATAAGLSSSQHVSTVRAQISQ